VLVNVANVVLVKKQMQHAQVVVFAHLVNILQMQVLVDAVLQVKFHLILVLLAVMLALVVKKQMQQELVAHFVHLANFL